MTKKQKAQKAYASSKELQSSQQGIDNLISIVILLMLVIIPLIVRIVMVGTVSPSITKSFYDTERTANVFTYFKFIWLVMGTILLSILFLVKLIRRKYLISESYINKPVAAMVLLVVFSSIFSQLRTISLIGSVHRNEGALTFLCYLILFFIAANINYSPNLKNLLIYALIPLVALNFILGVVYFYGYNILNNDFVLSLILPSTLSKSGMSAGSFINSTLLNPDFASGIGGVITLIFLTRALLADSYKAKIFNISVATGAFTVILTSLAKSGFFTIVALLPILVCIIVFSTNRKSGILTLAGSFLLFTFVLVILGHHNPVVWDKSVGFFVGTKAGNETIINLNRTPDGQTSLKTDSVDAEFNLPPLAWAPGTGRLYIWPKTLDLIKAHPILGYGRDTVPYFFNQDDPGKASGLADPYVIVDKPHNMLLDIAFGSGVTSLVAFVLLAFYHARENFKLFKNSIISPNSHILIVLFVGWVAFLVQGMFNDTIIGTGIVFWILFGASISIQRQERVSN